MEKTNLDTSYVWYADLNRSKGELNKVSASFCLAKWLQVTLHLHKGMTHSCHHPPTHKIEMEDIRDNPSGLQTPKKMAECKEMFVGGKPATCEYYCYIQNANLDTTSLRSLFCPS